LKIGLIAPEFLPNWGGVGTYCVELVKNLCKDPNLEIHVITLLRNIKRIDGSDSSYTETDILNYFNNKIHLHIISGASETFLYNSQFQYQLFRQLPEIVKENEIELLHSQHAHMSDILSKLRLKTPTVTTIHSTVKNQVDGIKITNQKWSEMDSSEHFELALYPMLRLAERFYLRKSARQMNIFVSKWTKTHIKQNYQYAYVDGPVIHNGVDAQQFSPSKHSDSNILSDISDPVILYASRLTVARGAHILAQAIPEILKVNKNVHFVFAGSGYVKSLRDILEQKGVPKDKVTLLGYVDYKDLPSLYAKSYAYAMPTSWENLPFKLLEAMSSGRPVITTAVGGIPEVVKNGYNGLFTFRTPHAIAETVIQLLDDPKLANRLGENARKTVVDNFTWTETARKTKQVYEKILIA